MVKQCNVCNKTFSILKSLVTTNDQLTCEECAQNERKLKSRRQKEESKEAQHRRKTEADQQRHRQELEQEEHQKMLELKERIQAEVEKDNDLRRELDMKRQNETEKECQHKRELQVEEAKTNGMVAMAEAEARKAEAKAKEAEAKAKEANSMARAAEAKMKFAEVEAKIKIAKTKEREMEHRNMLWKKYFDPETKMQDKQLIMEEIKGLNALVSGQKAPVVAKDNKAPKSKGDLVGVHPRRPWVTTMF